MHPEAIPSQGGKTTVLAPMRAAPAGYDSFLTISQNA